MPIDPAIPLQVAQPAQPFDPLSSMGKALSIAHLIGQNNLLGLQAQSSQADLDERDAIGQTFRTYDPSKMDLNSLQNLIMGRAPKSGAAVMKEVIANRKATLDEATKRAEDSIKLMGNAAGSTYELGEQFGYDDPRTVAAWQRGLAGMAGVMPPEVMSKFPAVPTRDIVMSGLGAVKNASDRLAEAKQKRINQYGSEEVAAAVEQRERLAAEEDARNSREAQQRVAAQNAAQEAFDRGEPIVRPYPTESVEGTPLSEGDVGQTNVAYNGPPQSAPTAAGSMGDLLETLGDTAYHAPVPVTDTQAPDLILQAGYRKAMGNLPDGLAYNNDGQIVPINQKGLDTLIQLRQAGATKNVINAFETERAKLGAQRGSKLYDDADRATNLATQARTLTDILAGYEGGPLDAFKAKLGQVVPAWKNLTTTAQLADQIATQSVSSVKLPGAASDFEERLWRAALPNLLQYGEGRELLAQILERKAEVAARRADITDELMGKNEFSQAALNARLKAEFPSLLTKEQKALLEKYSPGKQQAKPESKGAMDQQTSFDAMPDPAQYSGRRIQADDGTKYRSDGKRWVRE